MTRGCLRAFALAFVLSCGGSSQKGTPGAGGPARGSCTGKPIDTARFRDVTSCILQGETWDPVAKACTSSGQSCVDKVRETPGYYDDYGEHDCVQVLGCTWTAPGGDRRQNPNLGGTCAGSPSPCLDQLYSGCFALAGCEWSPTTKHCEKRAESPSDSPRCEAYSASPDVATMTVHPTYSVAHCNAMIGCTFKRKDGTIVDGEIVRP